MARKRIAISSGGGIAAGAPFVLNGALFIQQATPPVANSGRFARIVDATASLIAPGLLAPDSFVMGNAASDHVGGDRSILLGYQVAQSDGGAAQQTDNILIGNRVAVPLASTANQNLILIGGSTGFTFPGIPNSYGRNVVIGFNIALNNTVLDTANNSVVIGDGAILTGAGSVVIGVGARILVGGEAVAIGAGATAENLSVAIGRSASASPGGNNKAVAIGRLSLATSPGAIALGPQAEAQANDAMAFGQQTISTRVGVAAFGNDGGHPLVAIELGVTPATAGGMIRLPNAQAIVARNAANGANVPMIVLDATDLITLGDATHAVQLLGTDGAAAGVVVLTNAPTSNVVKYIPAVFNGTPGWIPFIW